MENEVRIVKSVDLGFGMIELRSDNILTFVPVKSAETVTLKELKQMLDTLVELSAGTPRLFYTDNTHLTSLGYSERQFIGKNLHRFATASGVKEDSAITRYIGHTIQSMFPPKVPMRMFSAKDDAFEWLHSL